MMEWVKVILAIAAIACIAGPIAGLLMHRYPFSAWLVLPLVAAPYIIWGTVSELVMYGRFPDSGYFGFWATGLILTIAAVPIWLTTLGSWLYLRRRARKTRELMLPGCPAL